MALAERDIQPVEKQQCTEEKYSEFERTSIGRWEYMRGEIRAMSSGTANHSTIAVNIASTFRGALFSRGCRVFGSDMKVHTGDGVNTFPDVSIACCPLQFHRGKTDLPANPLLIIEVLSDSTEPDEGKPAVSHVLDAGDLSAVCDSRRRTSSADG